jgi:hypothetical protein
LEPSTVSSIRRSYSNGASFERLTVIKVDHYRYCR